MKEYEGPELVLTNNVYIIIMHVLHKETWNQQQNTTTEFGGRFNLINKKKNTIIYNFKILDLNMGLG